MHEAPARYFCREKYKFCVGYIAIGALILVEMNKSIYLLYKERQEFQQSGYYHADRGFMRWSKTVAGPTARPNWSTDTPYAIFHYVKTPPKILFRIENPNLCKYDDDTLSSSSSEKDDDSLLLLSSSSSSLSSLSWTERHPSSKKSSTSSSSSSYPVVVMMFVITASQNRARRDIHRKLPLPAGFRRLFVVGLPMRETLPNEDTTRQPYYACSLDFCTIDENMNERLAQESDEHKDILQLDVPDVYYNLTYKTIANFQWFQAHCADAKFFVKHDDDALPNFPVLERSLKKWEQQAPTTTLAAGSIIFWHPERDENHRHRISVSVYPTETYPPFLGGLIQWMTADAVHVLSEMTRRVPLIHLEDVYGGILCRIAGLRLVHHDFANPGCEAEFLNLHAGSQGFHQWQNECAILPTDLPNPFA